MTPTKPNGRNANGMPLYRQVEHYLRSQITNGTLESGDMLPSVKDLCEQFGGINHLTVRQAIKNLSEENLVRSVQGRGSFVTGHTERERRVSLVLPHLESTLFIRIAQGAQDVLEEACIRSVILDSRGNYEVEVDHLQSLKDLPLDGALIFPMASSDIAEEVFKLKLQEFPFVLVDRYFEGMALPCVVVDDYSGGYQSAQYLAERNRSRPAWIGELNCTSARQRLDGFRCGLNDNGLVCPNEMIKVIDVAPDVPSAYQKATYEGVRQGVRELLAGPKFDSLVCCDDASALAALDMLREHGCDVPTEVAVIGFDDIPEAERSTPALTTIRQPMYEMGREAGQMLVNRLEDRNAQSQMKVLPVELIARESA